MTRLRPALTNPSPTASNSNSRSLWKKRNWVLLFVALLGIGITSLLAAKPTDDEGRAKSPAAASEDSSDEPEIKAGDVFKRIPDQKAYVGSPPTVIDVSDIFADTEMANNGPLTFSVVSNKKKKVAEAEVIVRDGRSLLSLKWAKIGKTEIRIQITDTDGHTIYNKFNAEVWEADTWKLIFTVVGGLGIFLLGMKSMSEGLQAVAGNGLRRIISLVTTNRLLAVGVGTLVTTLVQSSSVTTVMVVGFVNSGFMTLSQAIGVIMGANIGTTITGWILALKIGKYGLPMLGLGAFGYLFANRDRVRFLSMFFMGLGMVFFGLEQMKNGFAIVKDLPAFEAWFRTFQADNYFGVLQCAFVGCVLTFIVQSSSATLGITIGLTQIGVIQFDTAAALVMGENIGTTITAWLASFGTTTNAKRAAYFHVVFNLLGVAWITAVFLPWYLPAIKYIMGVDPWNGVITPEASTAAIAAAHTGFNVINTILFLPLAGYLARFLIRVIPEKAVKEKPHLTSLDVRVLETSVLAIEQSRVEVLRMSHGCEKMMNWLKDIIASEVPDETKVKKLFHREEVLDTVQDEITAFLANMLASNVPHDIVDEGRRQIRMADEYESVSDYITTILKSHLKLHQDGLQIPEDGRQELAQIHDMTADYLRMVSAGYEQRQWEIITKANSQGDALTKNIKQMRDVFLARMSTEAIDPQISVAYMAQLNAYRRVRDHTLNIAEALAGKK